MTLIDPDWLADQPPRHELQREQARDRVTGSTVLSRTFCTELGC